MNGVSTVSYYAHTAADTISSAAHSAYNKCSSVATAILDFTLPRNPVTQHREIHLIPECFENFLGAALYPSMIESSGGRILADDPEYGEYVQMVKEVGAELAAHSPREGLEFEFTVVRSEQDNAWCLPGGKIAINIGIIKRMENEVDAFGLPSFTLREKVAAVLSHEITHATARHAGRKWEFCLFLAGAFTVASIAIRYLIHASYAPAINKAERDGNANGAVSLRARRDFFNSIGVFAFDSLGRVLKSALTMHNSRSHELEADRYGMFLFADAAKQGSEVGFTQESPKAAVWLQEFFLKHHDRATQIGWLDWIVGLFSSHPDSRERLEANKATWASLETILFPLPEPQYSVGMDS